MANKGTHTLIGSWPMLDGIILILSDFLISNYNDMAGFDGVICLYLDSGTAYVPKILMANMLDTF